MWANFHRLTGVFVVAAALLLAPAFALARPFGDFPEKGAEAMAYYETEIDDWINGPVEYIALDEEFKAFKQLETSAQRTEFIEWFWDRRDDDPRDERNPFKIEFYRRVAAANDRYNGFPRGWRSDRGRVHVVLGRPDGIRPRMGNGVDTAVWTYYTVGPRAAERNFGTALGEMTVAFLRTSARSGYQIYGGFGGPGHLPTYVLDAFRFVNEASVVDPYLKRTLVD